MHRGGSHAQGRLRQDCAVAARGQWASVADTLREAGRPDRRCPRGRAGLHIFPCEHWLQIASTSPLEGLNSEHKRCSDVVGVFSNDRAAVRLVGALMLEQNDERAVLGRYMSLELLASLSDDPFLRQSAVAA